MLNVYILVSDQRTELTIEGSLELFGRLLATLHRVAPDAERKPARTSTAAARPETEVLSRRTRERRRRFAQDDSRLQNDSRTHPDGRAEADA